MTAAIALAVVLVIAVAGASMAMESQRSGQPSVGRPPRPKPAPGNGERTRRPTRIRDRRAPDPALADAPPPMAPPFPEPEIKGPELLRTGVPAQAKVVSVVDERTIGPVTRSRLVLRVEPKAGDPVEVTVRHAFQTPASRAQVKVGGSVGVRYDADDPRRVVLELPQE
jgi:hypothetical protein